MQKLDLYRVIIYEYEMKRQQGEVWLFYANKSSIFLGFFLNLQLAWKFFFIKTVETFVDKLFRSNHKLI